MILVTRLGGDQFAVNPDLIERAECNPDTVVTLVDGTKYVISESVDELIARIRDHRAEVIAAAALVETAMREAQRSEPAARRRSVATGTVVQLPHREH